MRSRLACPRPGNANLETLPRCCGPKRFPSPNFFPEKGNQRSWPRLSLSPRRFPIGPPAPSAGPPGTAPRQEQDRKVGPFRLITRADDGVRLHHEKNPEETKKTTRSSHFSPAPRTFPCPHKFGSSKPSLKLRLQPSAAWTRKKSIREAASAPCFLFLLQLAFFSARETQPRPAPFCAVLQSTVHPSFEKSCSLAINRNWVSQQNL